MSLKKQVKVMKENWLVLVVLLVVLFVINGAFTAVVSPVGRLTNSLAGGYPSADAAYDEGYGIESSRGVAPYYPGGSVLPDVQERRIVKSASLNTEVERGEFDAGEALFKVAVDEADALITNENVYTYEDNTFEYRAGSYSVNVPVANYDSFLTALKGIGEVQSFNENADDITGSYLSLTEQLETENARLARFNAILAESESAEEKVIITDRIFDVERTIAYLEEALERQDERIEYASVYVSINEERSEYAGVALAKLSQLVRSFVNSVNSVLHLIFVIIPYALAILIIWWVIKKVRK